MPEGALKLIDQVSNMPPWLAATLVVGLLGGGGTISFTKIDDKLDSIEKRQVEFTRRLDGLEWRIAQNTGRIDGQRTKNIAQDKSYRQLEKLVDRLVTLDEMQSR